MTKPTLSNKYLSMYIENGIIHTVFTPGIVVTLEIAKEVVKVRKEFAKGNNYKGLVDISGIKSVEFNARKFMASDEAYGNLTKLAIYSDNKVGKIIANFWLRLDSPYRPTKFFTNKASALLYLNADVNLN